MNITDEMIPVCGNFALESFALDIDEQAALEGAMTEAKDSIKSKVGNVAKAIVEKVKKTAKGKDAEALEKDKKHILKEQAKVAAAAGESRTLMIALKNNEITPEEFTSRFKAATEAVRISKAIVGIGKNDELTLQDLQEYTSFLTEVGNVIDEALESLTTAEVEDVPVVSMEIDETAIEGVWNCAYDAYTRNCEAAMEGMNITKKPLTKQEFQAVFNQERVREDENLRNAIAHGKYSRTELVDMGLLKEDTEDLGKGEYEQLLVDYEKELNEMKGKDEDAKAEYVKKHKLPHHLIHCLNGEDVNSYEDFIKSAKAGKKEAKAEKAEEALTTSQIISKLREIDLETDKIFDATKNTNKEISRFADKVGTDACNAMNYYDEIGEGTDLFERIQSDYETLLKKYDEYKSEATESAKVGDFTIVSKMEELEDKDKKTPQVKHNEAEAKKVEESIKSQNKQDKMPEADVKKQAPDKMNKALEAVEDGEFLEMLESIVELGDEEALAAIESLIDDLDEVEDEAAFEAKLADIRDSLKTRIAEAKAKMSGEAKENTESLIKELKEKYETCKELEKKVTENSNVGRHYGPALTYPEGFRDAHSKCMEILAKIGDDVESGIKTIREYCKSWASKIQESNLAWADESVETPQEPDNKEASEEEKSTDKKDIDEAAKKFVEKANIVKEHLVELKPRFAKDRKACAGEVAKVMREVEDLIPYASDITDNEEKIKAYDHIAQQRAALQKALDNIPQDVEDTDDETTESEVETKVAVEAKKEEDKESESDNESKKEEEPKKEDESSNPEVRKFMDNYRKFIISMKDSDNYGDDNLATNAIQCRAQATDLLAKCGESDKARLETIIDSCEKFLTRFVQELKKA